MRDSLLSILTGSKFVWSEGCHTYRAAGPNSFLAQCLPLGMIHNSCGSHALVTLALYSEFHKELVRVNGKHSLMHFPAWDTSTHFTCLHSNIKPEVYTKVTLCMSMFQIWPLHTNPDTHKNTCIVTDWNNKGMSLKERVIIGGIINTSSSGMKGHGWHYNILKTETAWMYLVVIS